MDLQFAVKVQPSQGALVRQPSLLKLSSNSTKQRQKQLSSLSSSGESETPQITIIRLSEIERGEICYLNLRRDARTDLFGLKQVGRTDFPTIAININIQVRLVY